MVWGNNLPSLPVILKPRPLQLDAGYFLLVPLLPHKKSTAPLPAEIWTEIFSHVYYGEDSADTPRNFRRRAEPYRRDLLLICRALTNIALPVFYSRVSLRSLWQLDKFEARLRDGDRQWDSLRRIPYSVPGRWVQDMDLSDLDCGRASLAVDELLTRLFPLLPFMSTLVLTTAITLSGRALNALTFRDGSEHLRSLKGIQAPITHPLNNTDYTASMVDGDPLVQLLRKSTRLEEIEIYGPGFDSLEIDSPSQFPAGLPPVEVEGGNSVPKIRDPLKLSNLRSLSMLSTHASPLMFSLLSSELPSLQRLVVTPYDDLPYPISLVSKFIQVHGSTLRSLYLYTSRVMRPVVHHPSPPDILLTCPNLTHLSLDFPLPELQIPEGEAHPLHMLSIPRTNQHCYQTVYAVVTSLKNLRVVRTSELRWLRRGMASQAMESGSQAEMRKWKKSFFLRGVTLVDMDMDSGND